MTPLLVAQRGQLIFHVLIVILHDSLHIVFAPIFLRQLLGQHLGQVVDDRLFLLVLGTNKKS